MSLPSASQASSTALPRKPRCARANATRLVLLLLALLVTTIACNKHVFEVVPELCGNDQNKTQEVGTSAPLDLLIVVDNSGSMQEEQQNLRDNFYDPRCPFLVPGVPEVPAHERNPTSARLKELEEVCGFIQILGAYDRDWRLGVITTDVTDCDNRFGGAPAERGRRPQRGCLQPAADGQKVLASGDVGSERAFQEILEGIGTWGSPVERGLDAVSAFLDPGTARDERCQGDLASFLRPAAELAVVILTDEDDCSYSGPTTPGTPMIDDGAAYACDLEPGAAVDGVLANGADCYQEGTALSDVARAVERLRALKPGKKIELAIIGGALADEDVAFAAGCMTSSGVPEGGCFESQGLSNFATLCGEDAREGQEPCCQADAAHRYFAAGEALGDGFFADSICYPSFRATLVRLASFIGRTDTLSLEEPPANPEAILVWVRRAGSEQEELLQRNDNETSPESGDGWWHAGGDEIRFAGPSAPGPGDVVRVAAVRDRPPLGDCVSTSGPHDGGAEGS